jgi:SAM-dependent methyltransferase
MFTGSAAFYDALYSWKDYAAESEKLRALIATRMTAKTLLDVGCGTGLHLGYLKQHYAVEGLDLDPGLLTVAREQYPDIPFHEANMIDFKLAKRFDVVTCLFSAIGYACTLPAMTQAIATMARHLNSGGLLIVEPWLAPDEFTVGHLGAQFVNQPELKIARMNIGEVIDQISILNFHYMVGMPEGIHYFTERHELGLFTQDEYRAAFDKTGLQIEYDSEGLMGRGLYIGTARP